MNTINSFNTFSNYETNISLSENGSPCIATRVKRLNSDTCLEAISVELCDNELHNIHDWIEDYFKLKNEGLWEKKLNKEVFEECISRIKTKDSSISPSVTAFILDIANYLDFTHYPRAIATFRNSVQIHWENNNITLTVEFLFISAHQAPLAIWEIKDKEGRYTGEGRINGDSLSAYAQEINKLVEIFYTPPTEEA